MHNLSFVCTIAGQCERALALTVRLRDLSHQLGDVRLPALSLAVRGDAYHGLGRYEDAVSAFLPALSLFRSYSIRRHHAICLFKLGYAYQAIGSHELAMQYLEESLPMFRQLALPSYEQRAVRALQDCGTLGHKEADRYPNQSPASPVVP